MSDPLNGVSAQALAAAEGSPPAPDTAGKAVAKLIAPLVSNERAFDSRTREGARQRADGSRRTAGTIGEAGGRFVEHGRRMIDKGLGDLPTPREVVRQGRTAIQDQPGMALLIAGAIGFGLGWLIHRRDG
jgi:ElaB/YqjD/DUF883 family membrane-anchored ribosome-binding protein